MIGLGDGIFWDLWDDGVVLGLQKGVLGVKTL